VKAIIQKSSSSRQLDGLHHFEQAEQDLLSALHAAQASFHEAMCDSFDTPRGMDVLSALVNQTNTYINAQPAVVNTSALETVAEWVTRMLKMLGLGEGPEPELIGWGEASAAGSIDVSLFRWLCQEQELTLL
jgi:cysteinyl-tRNA synthetase